ncbi:hypothetical protein [Cryptosporangium sp. NPDC048952]|uniref:hypothetical protein n=1 Tax=Cryptosporangium sp. NPDC048952 TaxID=3363961 RepID=UPI0037209A25
MVSSELLTVAVGASEPRPAPAIFLDCLRQVRVTRTESGRSAFQLAFALPPVDQLGQVAADDFDLFNRVLLSATVNGAPTTLIDGVTTHRELTSDGGTTGTVVTLTGEDLTVVMDREERSAEYPAHSEEMIVKSILDRYARYGIRANVVSPPTSSAPPEDERIPVQQSTDLACLLDLAARHDYVFRIDPATDSAPATAYWGPRRTSLPRVDRPLSFTPDFPTAERLSVRVDGLRPVEVTGTTQDPETGGTVAVSAVGLSGQRGPGVPIWETYRAHLRTERYRSSGPNAADATAWAAGRAASTAEAVSLTGRTQTHLIGALLPVPGIVDVAGAGWAHDGEYRITQVTHTISRAENLHLQDFTLSRSGLAGER